MATDEQLIRQIQQGENEAFSQLFCKYQKHIYSVCLFILNNPQDAEEVASDTFVHAYLKLDQLKNPEKFFAWLKKIAQNRSRDFLRSKREETIPFVYAMKQPSRQIAPDESLLKQELVNSIMEAIELLPQKDREVIQAHIDGLSHTEISERFGISYQASRSRLYRVRKNIAEYAKDLLNVIIGLPKMLSVKKIISGGILAMKIGTSTKITVGITSVLIAVLIGVFVTHHSSDDKQHEAIVQQEQVASAKQGRELVHSVQHRSGKSLLQRTEVSLKSEQDVEVLEVVDVSTSETLSELEAASGKSQERTPAGEKSYGEVSQKKSIKSETEQKETILQKYLRIKSTPEFKAEWAAACNPIWNELKHVWREQEALREEKRMLQEALANASEEKQKEIKEKLEATQAELKVLEYRNREVGSRAEEASWEVYLRYFTREERLEALKQMASAGMIPILHNKE